MQGTPGFLASGRMDEFRLSVTGSATEINALEEFCRSQGVETKRGATSANDANGIVMFALFLIAKFDLLPPSALARLGPRGNRRRT